MRILLFLATNLAVVLLASITFRVLGLEQFMYNQGVGMNMTGMLIFAAVFGMGGSFVSLLMSKWIAKRSTHAKVIDQPAFCLSLWLIDDPGVGRPFRDPLRHQQRDERTAHAEYRRKDQHAGHIHADALVVHELFESEDAERKAGEQDHREVGG